MQGAIEGVTRDCLNSVRKWLPDAEIILSTWEGSDARGLDYDILVLSKDPGGFDFGHPAGKPNNNNRMLLSSQAGLKKASRKYILKLRTDLLIKNRNFLKRFPVKLKRSEEFKLFEERILVYQIYTLRYEEVDRNPHLRHPRPFHISDWCFFGLANDVRTMFDVKLAKEPENSSYFCSLLKQQKPHKFHAIWHLGAQVTWRMSPEQYLTSECAKKHFKEIKFDDILDYNDKNIEQSEKFIVNNFFILTPEDFGIINQKPFYLQLKIERDDLCQDGVYTYQSYFNDYKKYCDPSFVIPWKHRNWVREFGIEYPLSQIKANWSRFFWPVKKIVSWLFIPLSFLKNLFRILIKVLLYFVRGKR